MLFLNKAGGQVGSRVIALMTGRQSDDFIHYDGMEAIISGSKEASGTQ